MAWSRSYGCSACGHTWRHLAMSKSEPKPPCPGCGGKPSEQLAAPSIGRGAVDKGIAIPQSQAKREQLAADLALKHTGMGDINSNMKPGDIAAKPVPAPSLKDLPAAAQEQLRKQITPGFIGASGSSFAQAAADPYKSRNMGIIGGLTNTPHLNQLPRRRIK